MGNNSRTSIGPLLVVLVVCGAVVQWCSAATAVESHRTSATVPDPSGEPTGSTAAPPVGTDSRLSSSSTSVDPIRQSSVAEQPPSEPPPVKGPATAPVTSVADQPLKNGRGKSGASVVVPEPELPPQPHLNGTSSGTSTTPGGTSTAETTTMGKARRVTNRDNKLMSVLQARRTALSRDRPWRKEYPSDVRHRRPASSVPASDPVAGNLVEDSSTPETANLIVPVGRGMGGPGPDEFLDTDESIHGMYVVNPRTGKIALQQTGASIKLAKETNNFIGPMPASETTKLSSAAPVKVVTPPTPTPTTLYSGRGVGAGYGELRGKRLRDRKTFPQSTEKSVEDGDLLPYQYFGQKLIPGPKGVPDARNQVINARRTQLSKLRPAEDPPEMVIEVGPPKASTEKSKFWSNRYQTRNAVALNHYLRRTTTTTSTGRPPDVHSDVLANSMLALSNLSDSEAEDEKQVFSRSANFSSTLNKTEPVLTTTTVAEPTTTIKLPVASELPSNHKAESDEYPAQGLLYGPSSGSSGLAAGISKLIINYPDDATPEELYRPPSSFETHAQTVNLQEATEQQPPQTTTVAVDEEDETARTLVSLPDINQIFRNLSTPTTTEMMASTTTTTAGPLPTTSTPSAPPRSRLNTRVYVPVSRSTTTRSTVGPVRTTTSTTTEPQPVREETEPPTTSVPELSASPMATEASTSTTTGRYSRPKPTPKPTTTTSTTTKVAVFTGLRPHPPDSAESNETAIETAAGFNPILSHIFPKLTLGVNPRPPPQEPELAFTSPPPAPDHSSGTRKPAVSFDGVLLHHNSDVVIEMRRMNTATFVLAGLGMLPIVIIVLYVIKATLLARENKVSHDLERYIPDGQPPISPVVRLEQSDTSSATDESIMTEHDFARGNLRFKSLLGEGNFGQVWKAEADDLAGHLGTTRIVAVKTERSDNGHGDLKAEAEIMRKLGSHPNVVTLLGACLEQEPQLLIMEYAMRGRLLSLLRAARGAVNGLAPSVHSNRPPIMPLSPRRLTGFAHDIARGMEYISEKKIVHRDLAARNVLLDHNGICKICDFGMSVDLEKAKSGHAQIRLPRHPNQSESRFKFDLTARSFGIGRAQHHGHHHDTHGGRHGGSGGHSGHSHGHDTKSRPALPIRWMAPEALQYHIFSRETDVWAFGIVLWEIATLGCTPYPNLSGREVVRSVPNGARPEVPVDCRAELYDLMQRTWRKDPRQRPTFTEARTCLARTLCQWQLEDNDTSNTSEYLDVSGFSEDLEQGMVYFNRRISEFECEI
ncbi:mucin-5AC [Anopheles bellator]|uniref:mucin-5AC n=1 Tax=Anopheles bellator TaxID=139047 RepID=UPI002649811F|nr:mucin-5AC [Anopheles bellator]